MADTKITALTALTAADPANDVIPIVDVSDTSMAASGTTKKISVNNILGASGTATLASATITGAATVGTTLGVTGVSTFAAGTALLPALTTTGDTNTGIYYPAADTFAVTTAGVERYRVDSTGLGIGGSAASKLSITDTSPRINFVTTSGLDVTGYIYNAIDVGSGGKLVFGTKRNGDTALDRLTIDASGNVGIATGNLVMGTSGKGIDFSAVTGGTGTATANVLNDYEEGTFTPTVGGSTGNGTAVYTKQIGLYTKIGRIVQIQIFVEWNTGTATGTQTVIGLPFTSNSTTDNYSILNTYPINISLTALNIATSSIPPGNSIVNIYQLPTGGGSDSNVPCDAAGAFLLTGTYTAA